MKEITIRWLDVDRAGLQRAEERTLEGEKAGYEITVDGFVRVWADDRTFVVALDRVILIDTK